MKFSKTRPVKIVQLGAGGTGGHIAPHLYRLLYSLNRPVRYIICDGDVVEEKNLVRQNFTPADLGENKAQVLAERYSTVFGMPNNDDLYSEQNNRLHAGFRDLLEQMKNKTPSHYYTDVLAEDGRTLKDFLARR